MKLLVVGSNPLVRRMVLNVVADLASDIRECASAAEAIAAYAGASHYVLKDDMSLLIGLMQSLS
jgi:CheY-like chemotaxis protein